VGSGVHVIFGGVDSPVRASGVVTGLITEGWEKRYGGRLDFIPAWPEILEAALASIERKRVALGLEDGGERVLFDMAARRSL